MKTFHRYTLRYSDVDASRQLRLSDLERYLLEAAGDSADQLGFGTDYILHKYNAAWVLTRLTVMMDRLPSYLQEIEIETWVEGNAHMLSVRDFRIWLIQGEEKQLIGKASTIWTVINMESRQVDMSVFADEAWEGKVDGEKLNLPRAQRLTKIEQPTTAMPLTILYTDLDYNNHCNSCSYLRFMLNTDDSLTAIAPIRLDINYAKEVHQAEHITVQALAEEQQVRYCILNADNEVSCTAMVSRYTPAE